MKRAADSTSVLRLNRRQALLGAAATIAGAMSLSIAPAFAQTKTPRRGGILTVMPELDTSSLDPLFGNATTIQRKFYNLFCEPLVRQEGDTFQPWLAERYEIAPDGKSITFHLRKDVVFQDGEPFNADAAKFNLDRLVDPALKPYPKQYVRALQSTDKIDDYTIRLNLSGPSVLMMPSMAGEPGMMLSPKALREKPDDMARFPIGTGPFRITKRTTGEVVAEKSKNYWGKGVDGQPLPYLDGVRLVVSGDATVRLLQVGSGDAQLVDSIQVKDFPRIRQSNNMQILPPKLGNAFILSFNVTKPPFDNIDLRRAVALAIDREAFVKVISQGEGLVLTGLEPPASWVYDPSVKGHVFNLAAAKEAYAKSGHKGPISLSIIQRDPDRQIAEMMQSMLSEAGIQMNIDTVERVAFTQKVLANKDFGFCLTGSPLQRPDVHTQYTFAYARDATTNYSGFKDEEIFGLVDQAARELDRNKRKQIYVKIQQLVIDKCIQSFLFWNPRAYVASTKLNGLTFDSSDIWHYESAWLDA
jgi:peptide/nickel transport system substrate-binding protein